MDDGECAVFLLRSAYLAAAALILAIHTLPALRTRFLAYGARATSAAAPSTAPSSTDRLLDAVASIRVPHAWFTSFYFVSTASSVLWLSQLLTKGTLFRVIATTQCPPLISARVLLYGTSSPPFTRVSLAWTMMFAQGCRRLYESIALSRPSSSQMWAGHWIMGIGFYLATNIALWVEGIPVLRQHQYSMADVTISPPSPRTFLALTIFILASGFQHDCHAYLASLKPKPGSTSVGTKPSSSSSSSSSPSGDYQLPRHPAFAQIVAPHYTAECLIYLALAVMAAPEGRLLNRTLSCALVFVLVNLGATAHGTKAWYARTFGIGSVRHKWMMVPLLF